MDTSKWPVCRLCGQPVAPNNNSAILKAIMLGSTALLKHEIFVAHFLPTDNCAGMPEVYQYIEGYPKENGLLYEEELEAKVRRAYGVMKDRQDYIYSK